MNKKPNVYVVNRSSHDFTDAHRFGDVVFLSEGIQPRYETNHIYRQFKPLLEVSEPHDYLLLTGLTVMNVIAASIMAVQHGQINLLIHKAETNSYVERRLSLTDLKDQTLTEFVKNLNS